MFHPDNIANMQVDADSEHPVSISTYTFWRKHGGVKGLAQKLRTDYKVSGGSHEKSYLKDWGLRLNSHCIERY
jgi:hypothetical protein